MFCGHFGDGRSLHAKIEFQLHGLLEHLHGGDRPQTAALGAQALHQPRRKKETAEIGGKALLDTGPQNLDGDVPAHRSLWPCEPGQSMPPPPAVQIPRTDFSTSAPRLPRMIGLRLLHARNGGNRSCRAFEIEGPLGADQIGPRRQKLPKLDVAGPQRRQCRGHRRCPRSPGARRVPNLAIDSPSRASHGSCANLLRHQQRVIGGKRAPRPQQIEAVPKPGNIRCASRNEWPPRRRSDCDR